MTALHVLCDNRKVTAQHIKALRSVTEAVKSRKGAARLTAAVHMGNPSCSCKLTRVSVKSRGAGTLPVTLLCRNPSVLPSTLDAMLAGLPRGVRVKDGTHRAGIHDICRNPALTAELLKVAFHYDPECGAVPDASGRVALHLLCLRPGGPDLEVLQVGAPLHAPMPCMPPLARLRACGCAAAQ